MAVITADPYKEDESDLDKAPQQLAGFEETPVHASDTMYSELLFLIQYILGRNSRLATYNSRLTTRNWQLVTGNSQLATRNSQLATRNSQLATRNSQLATRNSQLATRNSQLATRKSDWRLPTHDRRATRNPTKCILPTFVKTKLAYVNVMSG